MINFVNKKDLIIILAVVIASFTLLGFYSVLSAGKSSKYAEVIYDGEPVKTVELNKDIVFSINRLPNVSFEVKNNKIAFIKSDCPDMICVNTGYIDNGIAACLPNKVIVRIVDEYADIDAVIN